VVVVEGNVIKAIGKNGKVIIPDSAKVVNISGKSIMPGLIDAHAHGPQGSSEIIPQQNWKNYAGLALGVTTIHDPSNDTTEFFAASEMQKAGDIVSARLFSTGTILYGATVAGYTAHVDNLADAKFHVERLKKAGAFSVKSYNQPRRNQRQQFIQASRELEMLVMPEGGSLLQHNLTMVIDGHTTLEHSISTAKIYDDIKQLWSQSSMAYTPTMGVAYGGISGEHYWYDTTDVWLHPRLSKYVPSEFLDPRSMRRTKAPLHHYNHFNVAKVAKEMQDLGVNVNAGGHGQREGLAMHWEMWMMAQGGMTPLQALRTATISPAQTLGLDKQLGSIKVGKLADLIIVEGDVSQDIRLSDKVQYTMINGRLYNAETMNEIGNYDNKRAKFYFEQ
jgi:imidazolonepropionase-like amidohydrolase